MKKVLLFFALLIGVFVQGQTTRGESLALIDARIDTFKTRIGDSLFRHNQQLVNLLLNGGGGGGGSTVVHTFLDSTYFQIKSISGGDTVYTVKNLAVSESITSALATKQPVLNSSSVAGWDNTKFQIIVNDHGALTAIDTIGLFGNGGGVSLPTLTAPTLSTGSITNNSIAWSWNTPTNTTGFVFQTSPDNSTWTTDYTGSATSFNSTGMSASTLKYARVRGTASGYNTSPYGTASGTTLSSSGGNLLTAPSDFSNAAWTKYLVNVTTGFTDADGGTLADKIDATAVAGDHMIQQTISKSAASQTYEYKIRCRNIDGYQLILYANSGGTNQVSVVYSGGGSQQGQGTDGTGFSIISNNVTVLSGGSWYEVTFVFTTDAASTLTVGTYINTTTGPAAIHLYNASLIQQ